MNKIRNTLQKFFYNKYGADQFGLALVGFSLISSILATMTRFLFFSLLSMIIMGYALFRMFSKNYVKRRIENDKYLEIKKVITRSFKVIKMNITDHSYHYYLCPNCHQMVRVPRGRGKILITCPSCKKRFEKKS